MNSKQASQTNSPSASSGFLPLLRRRGSVISVASQVDKDTLNQALDNIHNAASQSETLTTFNEFAPPPLRSSGVDGKGLAADLHGGLSGLYSRLRASVGGPKEQTALTGENSDDTPSIKSSKINVSASNVSSRHASIKNAPFASPTISSSSLSRETQSIDRLPESQHSVSSSSQGFDPSQLSINTQQTSTDSNDPSHLIAKPKKAPTGNGKISLGPSSQRLAEPTVAGVTVNATKANISQNREKFEGARKASTVSEGAYSQIESSKVETSSIGDDYSKNREPTVDKISDPLKNKTPSGTPATSPPPKADRSSYFVSQVDQTASSSNGAKVEGPSQRKPSAEFSPLPTTITFKESPKPSTNHSPYRGKLVPIVHQPDSNNLQKELSRRRLAGGPLSRNNSSDATGVESPKRSDSYSQIASEEEGLHSVSKLPAKSRTPQKLDVGGRSVNMLSQIKNKVLSKEYWMRDENAKDCFECGEPFTTFRRKHHCRTCGQIFDAKCTVLISGAPFGQSGMLRVCKSCEGIINNSDASSEYSDDTSVTGYSVHRHGSSGAGDISPVRSFSSLRTAYMDSRGDAVPTMAIPATRKLKDESKKRPDVLEIDADHKNQMPRPGSSRSFKSMTGLRAHTSSHRRMHSRSSVRGPRPTLDDAAPFHRQMIENGQSQSRLPAFHSDNVIDPELADFMSDENSSGDEQASIMGTIGGDNVKQVDSDRSGISGLFTGSRKGRSRKGDKSVSGPAAGRDSDSVSLNSVRTSVQRHSKRRNMSVASNLQLRNSPRLQRLRSGSPGLTGTALSDARDPAIYDQIGLSNGVRVTRSSAMKGEDAPAVELNSASIQHVRKLLSQLLQDAHLPNVMNWEKALMPILLRATDDVTPDVQGGDAMDIRHYVKIKKIPGGRPGDTSYLSGLVFTKNLALKSMPRSISFPSILCLTFPLEFYRHKQNFMSLDLLMRQEREYLQVLVHRISALNPQLLLCQKNISRLALDFLDKAGIATAYNVKLSVLEAVARFAQTRVIHSLDKLAVRPAIAGSCASFYMKTYVHDQRKKTYMYLTGCPKELGCTIVLRGAEREILRKLKRITEFMLYVVYNLKLETSFLRDEFALIPSYTGAGTIVSDKATKTATEYVETKRSVSADISKIGKDKLSLPDTERRDQGQDSTQDKSKLQQQSDLLKIKTIETSDNDDIPDDIPTPTFYGDMVEQYKDKILSASPFVRFMQPYLLSKAREQERRLLYLKRLLEHDTEETQDSETELEPEKFAIITPDMIHENSEGAPTKVREILRAVRYAEYEKAVHNYQTQKKQWQAYALGNDNLFNPFAHQSITVLYSVVCIATNVPCAGPHMLGLGFYNEHEASEEFEADCSLGQYVEDLCLTANSVCLANGCEKRMYEHYRQYVHGGAQLSVTTEACPAKLRGFEDIILMWSVCRICGKETQVMPMSDNTWKYSFGQYLELSFWSYDLHARAGLCAHDLHRNHMRHFGFKSMSIRLQFDSIDLLEISVPRTRITWKVVNDLNLKNEVFTNAQERVNKFFQSVKKRIEGIKIESVMLEKASDAKEEIDKLREQAEEEHSWLIAKLQAKYVGSKYFEIIPLNRALRAAQEKVPAWDQAFSEFDRNFFPSEKDISRLAALQLKKIFLDRDESVTSLNSNEESTSQSAVEGELSEKNSPEDTFAPQSQGLSPEIRNDMMHEIAEKDALGIENGPQREKTQSEVFQNKAEMSEAILPITPLPPAEDEDVRHLDLVIPSSNPAAKNIAKIQDIAPAPVPSPRTRPVSPGAPIRTSSLTIYPISSTQRDESLLQLNDSPSLSARDKNSMIPRPAEIRNNRTGPMRSPPFLRTQSQPSYLRKTKSGIGSNELLAMTPNTNYTPQPKSPTEVVGTSTPGKSTKKFSDRLGLSAIKNSSHSMIPRSVNKQKKESKVSTLAKHFEQLSKEFERERLRDRNKRATRTRLGRAYPMKISKPVIEVYRNVHDAVLEHDHATENEEQDRRHLHHEEHKTIAEAMLHNTLDETPGDGFHAENTVAKPVNENVAEEAGNTEMPRTDSRLDSESLEGVKSDSEPSLSEVRSIPEVAKELLSPAEEQLELKLDLPKHEKKSLMNMLRTFWAERSASGWEPLEYVLRPTDHIFADSDVIIREDEPSSLIAFSLDCDDYRAKMQNMKQMGLKNVQIDPNRKYAEDLFLTLDEQRLIEHSLLQSKGTHLKYIFADGPARMTCKIFWAEQFDAIRRRCGVEDRFIECMSRCLKWESKGGKSKSVFLKTLDDRVVLKSLSQIETQSFLKFAPAYFRFMGEALFHELPSAIAKMLGFFQLIITNPVTGSDLNMNVLVMENLFYDRTPTRTFDLKGSMRNRRIQPTGEQNEVLLDENMVEFIYESPIFVREHSKRLLGASVYNDTLFLQKQNVMDYSLMVAIDGSRKEIVVGLIDCIRTYTWERRVERWVKSGKNQPTVISPREYKSRFREAMNIYILLAPNCWHQFSIIRPGDTAGRNSESTLNLQEQPPDEEIPAGIDLNATRASEFM